MSKEERALKILYLAAEASPFVKVGGLGDVAGSLPRALRTLPEAPDIRLAIPLHGAIERTAYDLRPVAAFNIAYHGGTMQAEVFETQVDNLPVYLIGGEPFSADAPIYNSDAGKDGVKYTFFSLAALASAQSLDWTPDVLHANDWHTAPVVYTLALRRQYESFFECTSSLLTVHNLPYLGVGAEAALQAFGIPPDRTDTLPRWARHLPLPLGLLAADHINAVSPRYAEEMLTPEFGSGLFEFLATRRDSLTGILNGIDVDAWNPVSDSALEVNYSLDDLSERAKNKRSLQAEIGLEVNPRIALISIVSRMDHQKGIDLALDALRQIADQPWQAVILGTGDAGIEEQACQLGEALRNKVRVYLRYDEGLARRMYAGSDMILIPSRYEPCGLTQMIAMRYGCIPIARGTGGLRDTITDYETSSRGTGFLFAEPSASDLAATIMRAINVYGDKRRWLGLQRRAMRQDFSWARSAREYLALYRRLYVARRGI